MVLLVTMILRGSLWLCVPLLASILIFQTGCLYHTAFAEYEPRVEPENRHRGNLDILDRKGATGVRLHETTVIIRDFSEIHSQPVMKVKQSEGERVQVESENGNKLIVSSEELDRLEKRFLKILGMKDRPKHSLSPNRSKSNRVSKELMELYVRQRKDPYPTTDLFLPGRFTQNANTVRTFAPRGAGTETSQTWTIFKFDLSSIPPNELVTGAELRVPFSVRTTNDNEPSVPPAFARVLSHDIVKPQKFRTSNLPATEAITYPTDSKLVNLTNRKYPTFWLTFDILPAVLRWIAANPTKTNHGLALEILGVNGQPYEQIPRGEMFNMRVTPHSSHFPTTLFIYSDDGHNSKARSKRSAEQITRRYRSAHHFHTQHSRRRKGYHRHKNRKRNLCSRKPMFVDFTDVGWNDWIVAPPGYQAFYCSGECPFPMAEHLNATNHAVIQALINSMNPALVPPPCCVPSRYSSLSLLYTDSSDRIVLKNYNEMVVDSCGCS